MKTWIVLLTLMAFLAQIMAQTQRTRITRNKNHNKTIKGLKLMMANTGARYIPAARWQAVSTEILSNDNNLEYFGELSVGTPRKFLMLYSIRDRRPCGCRVSSARRVCPRGCTTPVPPALMCRRDRTFPFPTEVAVWRDSFPSTLCAYRASRSSPKSLARPPQRRTHSLEWESSGWPSTISTLE